MSKNDSGNGLVFMCRLNGKPTIASVPSAMRLPNARRSIKRHVAAELRCKSSELVWIPNDDVQELYRIRNARARLIGALM